MNKSTSRIHKVAIIGAGKIAAGYDSPKSKNILTHAHAIVNHPRLALVGIADTDPMKGKKEARKWGAVYCSDYKEMLRSLRPDIVIIATPDHTHKEVLIDMLGHKELRAIVMEKPIVDERKDIASVKRAMKKSRVPVVVNFRRRYDVTVNEVRESLLRGHHGGILSATGFYTKGILHNGSHMIDLARYLFGEFKKGKMSFKSDDFPQGLPTLGGVATLERCPEFHLIAGDERSFYAFELEIVAERARLRFIDEGRRIMIQEVVQDTVYKDDRVLGRINIRPTKLGSAMGEMMAHVVRVADGVELPHSSLDDAIKTQETCYRLFDSFGKL